MVDKSEKFNWLVRVGYFSRAILYTVLGLIALTSASEIAAGTNGIFMAIEDFPLGTAILWIIEPRYSTEENALAVHKIDELV